MSNLSADAAASDRRPLETEHPHPERRREARDLAPDPPVADDPDGRPGELPRREVARADRRSSARLAASRSCWMQRHPVGELEDRHQRVLGHRHRCDAAERRDRDVGLPQRRAAHVVDARRVQLHAAQRRHLRGVREPLARVQQVDLGEQCRRTGCPPGSSRWIAHVRNARRRARSNHSSGRSQGAQVRQGHLIPLRAKPCTK